MFDTLRCMFGQHKPSEWEKIASYTHNGLDYYYKACTVCGYITAFVWRFQDEGPPEPL